MNKRTCNDVFNEIMEDENGKSVAEISAIYAKILKDMYTKSNPITEEKLRKNGITRKDRNAIVENTAKILVVIKSKNVDKGEYGDIGDLDFDIFDFSQLLAKSLGEGNNKEYGKIRDLTADVDAAEMSRISQERAKADQ